MKTFLRMRWATMSKQAIYQKITIRNFTTEFKLAELGKVSKEKSDAWRDKCEWQACSKFECAFEFGTGF
ncbi:hypothetical protein REC12_23900 [Desulfosporosinus sp. PR]|nr:hypothetical protein [Desulfosporosinus sp. PR]